jgi:hypothetical protein
MLKQSMARDVHEADIAFDTVEKIFFIDLSHRIWRTEDHVRGHFRRQGDLWLSWTGGSKCDLIVGFVDFKFDMAKLGTIYREHVVYVSKNHFNLTVRWGLDGDTLLRSTMRALAVRTHKPSNIYSTRAEALEVLAGLRGGSVVIENDPGKA